MTSGLSGISLAAAGLAAQAPPHTPAHPVTENFHGVAIADPYRWLEDQNSPETRVWLDQQIHYTQSFLSGIPVREKIKQRLEQLSRIDSYGLPAERQGRHCFSWGWGNETRPPVAFTTVLEG